MKTKRKEPKIVEEPLLCINVKVDRTIDGEYKGRLNWPNMSDIDLIDIFETTIGNEIDDLEFSKRAGIKCKMFKKRLKQYIKNKCSAIDGVAEDEDTSAIKNFDWQYWERY